VVKVNVHLGDTSLFARYNTVYARRFSQPYPARTTVGSDLGHTPGMAPFDVKAREQSRLGQRESLVRPCRDWGYPWTPLTFFAAPVALTVNLWMDRPVRSSLGLAVILLGIPFFYRWRKHPDAETPGFERRS